MTLNQSSSLGPISSLKVSSIKGCFGPQSFLDPDPYVNQPTNLEKKALPQKNIMAHNN